MTVSANVTAFGDADRVIIFDTTLRDGEQSPGASMNLEEKLRVAEALEAMGVDVIEAGFPVASTGDFEAVKAIAERSSGASVICGLSRATKGDIARCAEAVKPAQRQRIHTFISTSPLHMQYKLQLPPEEVLKRVGESVAYARSLVEDVEWSAEDGSRTEFDFLCRCVEAAIAAGASTINIPDTVGYAVPEEYAAMIKGVMETVPNADKAIFSVHCHNDLGLATANSLAAVKAGARQVECTINGLGERAGNAAMEEIVMAIRTRHDSVPFVTGIKTEHITKVSRMISAITGFPIQPNKAVVGANAFAHESGIHQDGMLKHAGTYEIMTPESVGLTKSTLVLGKHSGRAAFRQKLAELGYGDLGDNAVNDAFTRFKDLADMKKEVFDEDISAIIDETAMRGHDRIKLVSLEVKCGTVFRPPHAVMELEIDGQTASKDATGDGPVDAIFKAVRALVPHETVLELYQVHAVTKGTDAQAEVTVRLREAGKSVNGQGSDTDTMVASAKAYIHALNKLLVKRERQIPGGIAV
ncbi:2-isopropylmalate synthase [Oleispirillum naphthae]|uniref:2-isopropylmalate synthase n=1 Tax=Oleispirillum naphthae TaxID=2838853 RepID=UPI003082428F